SGAGNGRGAGTRLGSGPGSRATSTPLPETSVVRSKAMGVPSALRAPPTAQAAQSAAGRADQEPASTGRQDVVVRQATTSGGPTPAVASWDGGRLLCTRRVRIGSDSVAPS